MMRNISAISVLSLVLLGCATPAPINKTMPMDSGRTEINFILPPPNSIGLSAQPAMNDVVQRMKFYNYKFVGNGDYSPINGVAVGLLNGAVSIKKYKSLLSRVSNRELGRTSVNYTGTANLTSDGKKTRLSLVLQNKDYYAEPSLLDGKPYYEIEFTQSDALDVLKNTELIWSGEFTSKFNSESTYANFSRLARRESLGSGEKDEVTGKIFKEQFWIAVNKKEIPVRITTYPYRNGSKVVARANIPGYVSSNALDFSVTASEISKKIESIINS